MYTSLHEHGNPCHITAGGSQTESVGFTFWAPRMSLQNFTADNNEIRKKNRTPSHLVLVFHVRDLPPSNINSNLMKGFRVKLNSTEMHIQYILSRNGFCFCKGNCPAIFSTEKLTWRKKQRRPDSEDTADMFLFALGHFALTYSKQSKMNRAA